MQVMESESLVQSSESCVLCDLEKVLNFPEPHFSQPKCDIIYTQTVVITF